MAILVTGGAGYIGAHMALALCDRGEEVVVIDDLSTGLRAAVPPGAVFCQTNTGDRGAVLAVLREHRVDAIAHFAASIVVPESVADPMGYYLNNTVRAHALISAALDAGVAAFVFSSTAAVYGAPATELVDEDAATRPESPYGASKLMTERMLEDVAAAHGLSVAILRYFNVAGADPQGRAGQSSPRATHLIKVAAQAALGLRDALAVFGNDYPTPDGSCVRDYIHVSDLIDAHLRVLDHARSAPGVVKLNCGYGRGFSVFEVIRAVERVSGVTFPVRIEPRRPGDPARIVADSRRLRSKLGWTPRFDDLDLIVEHALAWERRLQTLRNAG